MKILNGWDLNNQRIVNLADPSSATDAATKQYIDNLLLGLGNKKAVDVATTTNGTLASAFQNGATVDGVSLTTGMRILIKDQTDQTTNGIYVVAASGAPTRATDADATADFANGMLVSVRQGTVNGDKLFLMQNNTAPTLGSDNIVFAPAGGGSYTGSTGITLVGSDFQLASSTGGAGLGFSSGVLSVNVDSTTIEVNSDTVRIAASAAGAGLIGGGGSALAVGAGTGISVAADAVAIDTSVVVRKYAATIGGSTSIAVTHNLGTKDIMWSLRQVSDDAFVITDGVATDTNTLTLTFAVAPSASSLRVVVQA